MPNKYIIILRFDSQGFVQPGGEPVDYLPQMDRNRLGSVRWVLIHAPPGGRCRSS